MGRAFHHLDIMQQLCLIVEYGRIVDPDNGQIVDKFTFSQDQPGMNMRDFNENVKTAKYRLAVILS